MYAFLLASREYTTRMEESGGYKGSGGHQLDRRREDCKGMEEFYCWCWEWSVRRGGGCRFEMAEGTTTLDALGCE
jgi:hypothetical protein